MKILSLLFFVPGIAFAFPEMTRHGYNNCISCHTTTAGGGLLNEYGRSLSRELLSQTSFFGIPSVEGEERFFYGLPKLPEGLLLQSDIRTLQTMRESKAASKGRFLIMQVDFDASYQIDERWRVYEAVGRLESQKNDKDFKDFITFPRYGVEYMLTKPDSDHRVTVKAGRFMPAYGIGFAEHTFVTRGRLDFMPGQERHAVELAWNNDRAQVIGTGIFKLMNGNEELYETGGVLQASIGVREKSKFGINYYKTKREDAVTKVKWDREVYGAWAHIAFNKDWYALVEVDRPKSSAEKWGLLEIFKLGYEVHQGWHLIAVQEYANLDMDNPNPKFEAFSIGTEWFPRPHWDFYALYRKERDTLVSNQFDDVVWLIGHFYL